MPETTILGQVVNENGEATPSQNLESTVTPDIQNATNISDAVVNDYLTAHVGEGKKYKTVEDLAKGYDNADKFIETLREDKRLLEAQLVEKKTIDEVLEAMNTNASIRDAANLEATNLEDIQPLTEADVENKLKALLADQATEAKNKIAMDKVKENQAESWVLLEKEFASKENAGSILQSYIGSDLAKKEIVDRLGSTDPAGLVAFLKATAANSDNVQFTDNSSASSTSTGAMPTGLTWSKARLVRQKDRKLFYSPAFQASLHEAQAKNPNFINT